MKRNRYSVEFKKEAVRLMVMEGMTAGEVSDKVGVGQGMLYRWKNQYLKDLGAEHPESEGMSPSELAAELEKTRKALAKANRINEILKKTVSYFSKDAI